MNSRPTYYTVRMWRSAPEYLQGKVGRKWAVGRLARRPGSCTTQRVHLSPSRKHRCWHWWSSQAPAPVLLAAASHSRCWLRKSVLPLRTGLILLPLPSLTCIKIFVTFKSHRLKGWDEDHLLQNSQTFKFLDYTLSVYIHTETAVLYIIVLLLHDILLAVNWIYTSDCGLEGDGCPNWSSQIHRLLITKLTLQWLHSH